MSSWVKGEYHQNFPFLPILKYPALAKVAVLESCHFRFSKSFRCMQRDITSIWYLRSSFSTSNHIFNKSRSIQRESYGKKFTFIVGVSIFFSKSWLKKVYPFDVVSVPLKPKMLIRILIILKMFLFGKNLTSSQKLDGQMAYHRKKIAIE